MGIGTGFALWIGKMLAEFFVWALVLLILGILMWWIQRPSKPRKSLETPKDWYVWSNEHRAWWRADCKGYTPFIQQAGLYTLEDARSSCTSRSWDDGVPPETMIHKDDVRPL